MVDPKPLRECLYSRLAKGESKHVLSGLYSGNSLHFLPKQKQKKERERVGKGWSGLLDRQNPTDKGMCV